MKKGKTVMIADGDLICKCSLVTTQCLYSLVTTVRGAGEGLCPNALPGCVYAGGSCHAH